MDQGNILLAIFLLHCLGAFGTTATVWCGQSIIDRSLFDSTDRPVLRKIFLRIFRVLGVFSSVELLSGLALLFSARWRDSAFGPLMILLVGMWLWELALRWPLWQKVSARGDQAALKKWRWAGWGTAGLWTVRSLALIVVALY